VVRTVRGLTRDSVLPGYQVSDRYWEELTEGILKVSRYMKKGEEPMSPRCREIHSKLEAERESCLFPATLYSFGCKWRQSCLQGVLGCRAAVLQCCPSMRGFWIRTLSKVG